jgi:hypothetical protein
VIRSSSACFCPMSRMPLTVETVMYGMVVLLWR